LGQLLVVAHHTDTSLSLCYEPELIPDPDGLARCLSKTMRPDSWIREQ